MAEFLTRAMFEELGMEIETASAGTLGIVGAAAPSQVLAVCEEFGIDASAHRSQPLGRSLIEAADLVVVMEDQHGDRVLELVPSAENKLVFLGDYSKPAGDVSDPIGQDVDAFRVCRDTILHGLHGLLPEMLNRFKFAMVGR
jgi:protein-tyrosine-phosphatase